MDAVILALLPGPLTLTSIGAGDGISQVVPEPSTFDGQFDLRYLSSTYRPHSNLEPVASAILTSLRAYAETAVSAYARFQAGLFYLAGFGTRIDLQEALGLMQAAARQGYYPAQGLVRRIRTMSASHCSAQWWLSPVVSDICALWVGFKQTKYRLTISLGGGNVDIRLRAEILGFGLLTQLATPSGFLTIYIELAIGVKY